MFFTGTRRGQRLKCEQVAETRADGMGKAILRVPEDLRGEVWVKCEECQVVSKAVAVAT
jgi:hypothetical protein